jgi:putative flippase GtrA
MSRSLIWFLVVGTSAALTHAVVFGLTNQTLWPEVANALGFAVAFWVSFFGHRLLSFQDAATSMKQSLLRFVVTSLAGFAANAVVFSLLLRVLEWPRWLALFLAMVFAAAQTYGLSRYWAFRR